MELSFSEIRKWDKFEDLVAAYLRKLEHDNGNNVTEVKVQPPGKGADGGRDILVTFRLNDGLSKFSRKWVVQCKFYNKSVSAKEIADVNIPSLIHQYGADGFLLVCKNDVTRGTTNFFEGLAQNCSFKYEYLIWTGQEFLERLHTETGVHEQFFPKYWNYIKGLDKKTKGRKNKNS